MKIETHYCDFCKKQLEQISPTKHEANGVIVEIGWSEGGWGYRKYIHNVNTEDICNNCFTEIDKFAQIFINQLKSLKAIDKSK